MGLAQPGHAESQRLGHDGECMVRLPSNAKLIKHHKSDRHTRAVHMCLRRRGRTSGTAEDTIVAPTVEEFADLLQRSRRDE